MTTFYILHKIDLNVFVFKHLLAMACVSKGRQEENNAWGWANQISCEDKSDLY